MIFKVLLSKVAERAIEGKYRVFWVFYTNSEKFSSRLKVYNPVCFSYRSGLFQVPLSHPQTEEGLRVPSLTVNLLIMDPLINLSFCLKAVDYLVYLKSHDGKKC